MVQYVLKRVTIAGRIAFLPPADAGANANIKHELKKCRDKYNDYVLVTMQPPKHSRTTGKDSQNQHLNGHIMQICNETKNSFEAIKYCIKMLAVEEMGYPYEIIDGHIWPQSESDASTDECALLIEAAHVWAAHNGIILQE
jgi:hypothetical protein